MDAPGGFGTGGISREEGQQFQAQIESEEQKKRKKALQEAQQLASRTMMNNRLKERALARNKLTSFTQGTTLSRPLTGDMGARSLFDSNNSMPSLLGEV